MKIYLIIALIIGVSIGTTIIDKKIDPIKIITGSILIVCTIYMIKYVTNIIINISVFISILVCLLIIFGINNLAVQYYDSAYLEQILEYIYKSENFNYILENFNKIKLHHWS